MSCSLRLLVSDALAGACLLRPRRGREAIQLAMSTSPPSNPELVLVVDDEPGVRDLLLSQVGYLGYRCQAAMDGHEALRFLTSGGHPDLVLSDINMPELSGLDLLRRIKSIDPLVQVVMVSGLQDLETVRTCLREGAYDYVVKPFELDDLGNTVERALERGRLIRQNEEYRRHLERMVQEQTEEIRQTRDMALLTLAKLAESRHNETGLHLDRMAQYSRRLAEELRKGPYASQVTLEFVEHLHKSSPLHDIGKVGIPDAVLMKPGPLTDEEEEIMKTHTTIGGDTLRYVVEKFERQTFLTMGMQIAYHHHERWDGMGYPENLRGAEIPLPARLVTLADAYDAITSVRPYKTAHTHQEAVARIELDRGRHFDPVLVDAFLRCHQDFDLIHRRYTDAEPARRGSAATPRFLRTSATEPS